jgi:hypothetical protein
LKVPQLSSLGLIIPRAFPTAHPTIPCFSKS